MNTYECLQTLEGHTNIVTSVAISGNKIVSGSYDKTVKIWGLNSGECLKTLRNVPFVQGHAYDVTSVAISGDKIISGSDDETIKIWDLNTE